MRERPQIGSLSDHVKMAFARALSTGLARKSGWYSPPCMVGIRQISTIIATDRPWPWRSTWTQIRRLSPRLRSDSCGGRAPDRSI